MNMYICRSYLENMCSKKFSLDPHSRSCSCHAIISFSATCRECVCVWTCMMYCSFAVTTFIFCNKIFNLQQLSVTHNQLLRMYGVSRLHGLTTLNLANNSILTIEGLKDLVHLKWLCLAANKIKVTVV